MRALLEGPRAAGRERDYYLLSCAYYLALRGAEAVCLRSEQVDLEGHEAHIPSAKKRPKKGQAVCHATGRPFISIPILHGDDVLRGALAWSRAHGSPWMFPSRFDDQKPISTRQFRMTFRYWAKKAGLNDRVSAHSLRHSAGTHVFELAGARIREAGGDPLVLVRDFMRHSNISITSVYFHTTRSMVAAARKAMKG